MPNRGNPNWVKGKAQNPEGKKPGTKNSVPRDLVKKVLFIAEKLEEEGAGLEDRAREKPDWFYEHFVKVLIPKNVSLDVEGALKVEHVISEAVKAKLDEVYETERGS